MLQICYEAKREALEAAPAGRFSFSLPDPSWAPRRSGGTAQGSWLLAVGRLWQAFGDFVCSTVLPRFSVLSPA